MSRTTIYISDELHNKVKLYCVTHKISLSCLINSLLIQCLSFNENDFEDSTNQ